jgi:hypothetical protein
MRSWKLLPLTVIAAACTSLAPQRSDDLFGRVQGGMTQHEVLGLAGAPDNTMSFPLSRHMSWGYFYFDTWGFYAEFSVTFSADGRAISKMSRRVNDGGDLGS